MQELPHGWFLSELLAKRAVGETEIKRVISRLYSFYESEAPRPEIEEWGRSEKLKISTDENFAQVTPFVGNTHFAARLRCDPPFHQQILRGQ